MNRIIYRVLKRKWHIKSEVKDIYILFRNVKNVKTPPTDVISGTEPFKYVYCLENELALA